MTIKSRLVLVSMFVLICISILLVIFPVTSVYAQPEIEWEKTFGGSEDDVCRSIQQSTDGGYILVGGTKSFGAGGSDIWLIKTDSEGNMLWSKTYGDTGDEEGYRVQQTSDGGYIIVGSSLIKTDSTGNKIWEKQIDGVDGQQTSDGGYIIIGSSLTKTDSSGNKLWEKSYGGGSVIQSTDGGFAIISEGKWGYVSSLKLDSDGDIIWNKTYGIHGVDKVVLQTIDGGYILLGNEVWGEPIFPIMNFIKIDPDGNEVWSSGSGWNTGGNSIYQTMDGGYIITGDTHEGGDDDVYFVKFDEEGNMLWEKTFGGPEEEGGTSVQQTGDGGYIVAGYTESFGAGKSDFYLIKLMIIPEFVIPELPLGTIAALLCMLFTVYLRVKTFKPS